MFLEPREAHLWIMGDNSSDRDHTPWAVSHNQTGRVERSGPRPKGKPGQRDIDIRGIVRAASSSIHPRFLPICGTVAPSSMHRHRTGSVPIKNTTPAQSMHCCSRAHPFRSRKKAGGQVKSHPDLFCSVQRKKMIAVNNFYRLLIGWRSGNPPMSQDCPKPMMRGSLKATTAVHSHEYIYD
jgi:hypothetical protein